MGMSLCLTVRLFESRFHGVPDWPPSPARVFQALVAGAAEGRFLPRAVRAALEWLECQDAPVIAAPHAELARAFTSFVPNNDGDATELKGDPTKTIRIGKDIRPRLIHGAPEFTYVWQGLEGEIPEQGLRAAAEQLYQLGRGVDPAFADLRLLLDAEAEALLAAAPGRVHRPGAAGQGGLACPVRGSAQSLALRHQAFLGRFAVAGQGRSARTSFATPPRPVFRQIRYDDAPRRLVFDLRRGDGRFAQIPATRAGQIVSWVLHGATRRLTLGLTEPDRPLAARFVLGQGAGPQDLDRRVRVFALPTVRPQGDRAIRRVAVQVPADCPLRLDDLTWAFSGLDLVDPETGVVDPPDAGLVAADDRAMLARYLTPARTWRTETAAALPAARGRARGQTGTARLGEETAARKAVALALRHAGVNARVERIHVQKEPFAGQVQRAEAFAPGTRFEPARLWHVEIGFAQPVQGPLILGDGRFLGLGLMVPDRDVPGILAFRITGGLANAAPEGLAQAFRRAVMAQVRDERGRMATFFSGHTPDGARNAPGTHEHIACTADLARGRLLIVPPHCLQHRRPGNGEPQHLNHLERSLSGFQELRAGSAGLLSLEPATVGPDDPLLAPARLWDSVTPVQATIRPRRTSEETLTVTIHKELRNRGLPRAEVQITQMTGPSSGHARLSFRTAQSGPILLGRTLHKGGGLFAGVSERAAD